MQEAPKRLTRSRRDRVFGGICGGLASYLGWDAVLVRVAWVALTVLSAGSGILLYLLAWIIVPLEEIQRSEEPAQAAPPRRDTRTVLGVLAVVVGLLALSSAFLPWFWRISSFRIVGPVVLILIGAVLLLRPSPAADRDAAPPHSRPETTDRPHRRLVRIHRGRKIAGVCNGLGAYFEVDPTLMRLLGIVLVLAGGAGLLIYVLLWIAMPLVDKAPDNLTPKVSDAGTNS